ncbi:MAG: L-proline glycine betaine binding transporter protein ProX [Actinobacteria bacterium]|nr:L-proline glycine betaine binding transporter protein ProX [Actinomycetota bacterium]
MVRKRRFWSTAAMLVMALVATACGGKSTTTGSSPSSTPKPSVTVGSVTFSESQIVAEMFAQVLTKAGYKVTKQLSLGQRAVLQPAMPGTIQVAPEYVGSLLASLKGTKSSDPVSETAQDNALLAPKGLTVLDPSAANDTNAFVVTKATATRYNLAKVSDLKPVASKLTLGGPPECNTNPVCLPGLKSVYGITGLKFQPIVACDTATANALDAGSIDIAELCSTQSIIAKKGYVVLDDDKNLQPADNITAEVSTALLIAQPDVKTLLAGVLSKLTTANIVPLNAAVDIDHKDAATVAKDFLTSNGLL